MLLDAASMYFRAYFALPDTITGTDGRPVNAVRGFVDALAALVRERRPTHLVAVFDADWRPQFRVDLLPSYKAHRLAPDGAEEVPDTLSPQVPIIEDVLDSAGIARCEAEGFEADDVVGALAQRSAMPVDVVTGDRDLFQLVDDPRDVKVLYTARGFRNVEVVDESVVRARYGVAARHYADFATLRGDPSDGLPGVKGIGAKSAAAIVNAHGSIEDVLRVLDEPGTDLLHRAKLAAARDYLEVAPQVVRVRRDLGLPELDDALPATPRHSRELLCLAEHHNLAGSVQRLVDALAMISSSR